MSSSLYLLYESALGFGLFERVRIDEIGIGLDDVQKSINDLERFSKIIKLKAFLPFASAESALENINSISQGEITKFLADWLHMNVPKDTLIGVVDPKIGNSINETIGIKCQSNELILELLRGVRTHFVRYMKGVTVADLHQAQLGLCHSFSRSKVKFNVHRLDTMIIQSICLLDQLEKDVNTITMRAREWYGMHFPELAKIVTNSLKYCIVSKFVGDRKNLNQDSLEKLTEILEDEDLAQQVIDAGKISMGTELSENDWLNLNTFIARVASLHAYHTSLHNYVCKKMNMCAPNLTSLIGEQVGARLIAKAGSLTNLAKYPASTVQILGAEKALFRALKTKGKTPKHGLLYNSTFIGRAAIKNRGRISRTLANKCSIASRIDAFSDDAGDVSFFGQELRKQVEERLEFYKNGTAPRKNTDAMEAAKAALESFEATTTTAEMTDVDIKSEEVAVKAEPVVKKEKKEKKAKRAREEDEEAPAKKKKRSD